MDDPDPTPDLIRSKKRLHRGKRTRKQNDDNKKKII